MNSVTALTSSSVTFAPCTRCGLLTPCGKKSMSPRPSSFSAPAPSSIVRESTCEATVKAMREGMLAFITPVITFTEGRCVAITRCMPAARASCARRQMASSTSPGATIMRSASSSIMTTICGSGFSPSRRLWLKPFMSRTPRSANFW